MSHAYQSLGQYSNALAKLEEALPIAEKIDGGNLKAIILSNLGNVCIYINQYDKAETFLQESLLLAKNDNNRNVMPYVLNNLGIYTYLWKSFLKQYLLMKKVFLLQIMHTTFN